MLTSSSGLYFVWSCESYWTFLVPMRYPMHKYHSVQKHWYCTTHTQLIKESKVARFAMFCIQVFTSFSQVNVLRRGPRPTRAHPRPALDWRRGKTVGKWFGRRSDRAPLKIILCPCCHTHLKRDFKARWFKMCIFNVAKVNVLSVCLTAGPCYMEVKYLIYIEFRKFYHRLLFI